MDSGDEALAGVMPARYEDAMMIELPKSQWRAQLAGAKHIVVATHASQGYYDWTKVRLSDAMNNSISRNNFERVVIDKVQL